MRFILLLPLGAGLLRGPMGQLLDDFQQFKLHLARDQAGYIAKCAEADMSLDTEISCGNTMSCFLEMLSASYTDATADARNFSAALAGDYEDSATLRELVGAGPHPDTANYVPLLRTVDGRRFLRRHAQAAVDRLRAELFAEEASQEPRVFSLGLQWFQVVAKRDMRAPGVHAAVLDWAVDGFAAREPDFVRPKPEDAVDLSMARQMVEAFLAPFVLEGRSPNPNDPCRQRGEACVTFQWPNRKKGGLFELPFTDADLLKLCLSLEAQQVEPGFAAWKGCTALQLGVRPAHSLDQQNWQNHVLAIVKRPGPKFEVLQGYIESDVERGYDLTDWLCSSNPFADLRGFGPKTMEAFLGHMDTFVANSALGEDGTKVFDGENHAATFLVTDEKFVGKPYLATFWASEVVADEYGSGVLRQMVREDARCGPLPKLEELCRDATRIHGGKLMPGETLRDEGAAIRPATVRTERWTVKP